MKRAFSLFAIASATKAIPFESFQHDLSKMESRKNPYAAKLKKSVTMRLSEDVIGYFKKWPKKKVFHPKV